MPSEKTRHRKRKKKKDRAWHPRQNAAPRDITQFSTEGLIRLMQAANSPAAKVAILNTTNHSICQDERLLTTPTKKHASEVLTPTRYTLSTPDAGPKTSHLITPKGSKLLPSRIIECDDGIISVFLSEDKVRPKSLIIPGTPTSWIAHSPIPKVSMDGMLDIAITKKQIKAVEALTRNRKKMGENPRKISQNALNGIPATQALRKAGISVENGDGHYAHFIPFWFLGDEAQTVNNMGIATRHANAAMELVNPAIRRLLYMKNGPKVVYLSAIPTWEPGYENIRLLRSITYVIKDGQGNNYQHLAKVTFNMLSLANICLTDVRPVRESIIAKFSDAPRKKPLQVSPVTLPIVITPPAVKAAKKPVMRALPSTPTKLSRKALPASPTLSTSQSTLLLAYSQLKCSPFIDAENPEQVDNTNPTRKLTFQ